MKLARQRTAAFLVALLTMVWLVGISPAVAHEPSDPPVFDGAATCGPAESADRIAVLAASVAYYGCGHPLIVEAIAQGLAADVLDDSAWSQQTADDFAQYRAVVIADNDCGAAPTDLAAAAGNAATWSAAATGNVLVIGTDESFHSTQGGEALMRGGLAFAVADHHRTGAYVSLGCTYDYYEAATSPTEVPLLSGFGDFKVLSATSLSDSGGCFNNAHIVATHPALSEVTDASLSNWGCSVHEVFTQWPGGFEVLAIALDGSGTFEAADGTSGTPYIVARGVQVISDITLTPETADLTVGDQHAVTATVLADGAPVAGTDVVFTVASGPNAGVGATVSSGSDGTAEFSYVGAGGEGADVIRATFVDELGRTQRSNDVTATWTAPDPLATTLVLETGLLEVEVMPVFVNVKIIFIRANGTLTATTPDGEVPVPGKTVTFTASGTPVCSAVTDTNGNAKCTGELLGGQLATVLGLGYDGAFAGDSEYLPSSGHGPLISVLGIKLV